MNIGYFNIDKVKEILKDKKNIFIIAQSIIIVVLLITMFAVKMVDSKENAEKKNKISHINAENTVLNNKIKTLNAGYYDLLIKYKKLEMKNESVAYIKGTKLMKKKDYKGALYYLEFLSSYGKEKYIVESSMYFTADCYRLVNSNDNAVKYYCMYIKRFPRSDYYEDALYNCGMLYDKMGREEDAKTMFRMLVKVAPNSIYINSNVRDLLGE